MKRDSWPMRGALGVFLCLLVSCSALVYRPCPTTLEERLAHFPTKGLQLKEPASVRWSENLIPFIEAKNQDDAAYLFGMAHAFLRIGQMEILRRVSQGRLSESAGPFTVDIDRALRIFNFGYAAKEIITAMPPETRRWVERYVEGINDYLAQNKGYLPVDLKAADAAPTPWTLEDLVGVWRLASTDVNWLVQLTALLDQGKPWAEALLKQTEQTGEASKPSFGEFQAQYFKALFFATETGSNSMVIAAKKSASGAALIASDPHLAVTIPNIWVIVALSYPGSKSVGLSIPGVPFIALGRSETAAWGGTNMWGISTALHSLTPEELASATTTEETIRVRGWLNSSVKIRRTKWGPVITDAPQFAGASSGPIAVRWLGHEASDEITGFLNASRAKSFSEFRNNFSGYAVSAQNLLFADRSGDIGHLLAYRQPQIPLSARGKIVTPTSESWASTRKPTELPFKKNPAQGFLVSANNVPVKTEPPIGSFFQSSERFLRLTSLASAAKKVSVSQLKEWQLDTLSPASVRLLRSALGLLKSEVLTPAEAKAVEILETWDGKYEAESKSAVLAEFFLIKLGENIFEREFKDKEAASKMLRNSAWRGVAEKFISVEGTSKLAHQALTIALERAAGFPTWGDAHRARVAHPFSNIPLLGGRYQFGEFGTSGGSDTVFKSTARPQLEKSTVDFGSNARHISDLSDLDENYFCLFGGQDGWLTSPATTDQVELWKRKEWIKVPLSERGVRESFPKSMALEARN